MKKLSPFAILVAASLTAASTTQAAVTALVAGQGFSGTITSNPGNFVLDTGYMVPTTNTTDPVLFETGGDGIGTTLAYVGTDLVVFQDQNSGNEPTMTIDISAFAGQTISIRLDGDYRPANGSRLLSLDVVPTTGAPLSTALTTITTNDARFSGGDGSAFGGISGSLGGHSEAASPVTGFDNAARDITGPGASVLDATELEGVLYNGADADAQRALPIPAASTYFIPEPSAGILLMLGLSGSLLRRRRK